MRHSRVQLAAADMHQLTKDEIGNRAADVGKGVAVEEEERRPFVAAPQEIQRLAEGQDLLLFDSPVGCDCFMAL